MSACCIVIRICSIKLNDGEVASILLKCDAHESNIDTFICCIPSRSDTDENIVEFLKLNVDKFNFERLPEDGVSFVNGDVLLFKIVQQVKVGFSSKTFDIA